MKNNKYLAKIALLAVLLVVLLNPSMNPLLSEGTKGAVAAELRANFGILTGSAGTGFLSAAKIITALAVVIFMWLATTLVCFVMEKLSRGKKRSVTVASMAISVVKTVSGILTIVWVLSVMGVNIGTIFASLGIVSLIVGFGVQSLIEDCVTGLFIIFEGLYNIGDIIVLDTFRGTVEKITLRTTTLRDTGGNLQVINNSDIRNIQNRSAVESLAVCDIGITYEADIREVEKLVLPELQKIYEENSDVFLAVPRYSGVQSLDASSVTLRFNVPVKEENYFTGTRRLNRAMKCLFDDKGIEIPFNQLVIHNAK